jgi:hypothetical protein
VTELVRQGEEAHLQALALRQNGEEVEAITQVDASEAPATGLRDLDLLTPPAAVRFSARE